MFVENLHRWLISAESMNSDVLKGNGLYNDTGWCDSGVESHYLTNFETSEIESDRASRRRTDHPLQLTHRRPPDQQSR